VALYLQKNPSADFSAVRQAIISTARKDAFTASNGPLPNGYWGNGKLDIFAALAQPGSGVADEPATEPRAVSISSGSADGAPVLRMTLAGPAEARLTLCDLTGRDAASMELGRFGTGSYSLPLDLGDLAQGVYLYRVRLGGNIHTGTLRVLR
jgi:hypothetical protein